MKHVFVKVNEKVALHTLKQFSRFLPHILLLTYETQTFLYGTHYAQKQVCKSCKFSMLVLIVKLASYPG